MKAVMIVPIKPSIDLIELNEVQLNVKEGSFGSANAPPNLCTDEAFRAFASQSGARHPLTPFSLLLNRYLQRTELK